MKNYILGIDTSAYTSSLAVVDIHTNEVIYDKRKVLSVPYGKRGLRQQEAVFQHLKNIRELYSEIDLDFNSIQAVSVSSKPRNAEGSYMPVFCVGQNIGSVIAKSLNCAYLEYSHQENHIAAALAGSYKTVGKNIIAVHISGGTTEFLRIHKADHGYDTTVVGGSKDITFGQLIDRIGCFLGFQFPCGYHMDNYLAHNRNIANIKTPKSAEGTFINLSGMENFYKNLYISNKFNKESVINSLFMYTSNSIINILNDLKNDSSADAIILTGGVASNTLIRSNILNKLTTDNIILPTRENSSDNAIGTALLPIIDRWYHEAKPY